MSTSKSYHRVLFNNLSSILFWSNLKLLLLQHYSIYTLICFLFCLITHGTLVLLNYTNFFGSAVTHLCHKHDDIICYHTLLPSEGWISDHVTAYCTQLLGHTQLSWLTTTQNIFKWIWKTSVQKGFCRYQSSYNHFPQQLEWICLSGKQREKIL